MKTFLMLVLISSAAVAGECKLKGKLVSEQSIETSFQTSSIDACKSMAENTKTNNFYGLVEKEDLLVETSMTFKEEEISKDTISFEEESSL